MLSPNATPTPITPPRVPLVDPRTGLIDRAWYMFFISLINAATLVYDGDLGPSPESLIASYDAALQALAQNVDTQPLPVDLSAELTKQIEAAGLANYATGLLSQITEMQKQLDALNLLPPPSQGTVIAVTGTTPVVSTGGISPNISMAAANTSTDGYLTSTDWNTFNNKAPATSGTSILYGNGSGGFSNVSTGSGVSFVAGVLSATGSGGTITSVTATAPIASSGGFTPNISINAAYGDTVNPYAAKTANYVLAGPTSGAAAAPTFRALVAADIPSLSYVTSVSGTSPVVSSGGTTPAISMPAATTLVNGYLTSTDWNTFNDKQAALVSGTNIKTVNGTSLLGSGDVGTITYAYGGTGQTTVTTGDLLYGSATNTWSKLGIGSTGQVLRVVSGTPAWGTDYVGTVTSVAATVPSFLSISGSPITSSGTLAIGLSGTALPTTSGGTGLTSFTANGVVYASSSSALATGSALTFDGTNFATTGSVTSAGSSNSGNLTFTGTGNRITGDFSNATVANRVAFQTSTVNGSTQVNLIPNGTSTDARLFAYTNSADLSNSSFAAFGVTTTSEVRTTSGITGTGTYLPMTFYTGGSEQVRITTAGALLVGTTTNNGEKLRFNLGSVSPATSGNMNTGAIFQAGGGSQALNIGQDGSGTWYNSGFANNAGVAAVHRWLVGGTERMSLSTSGIVTMSAYGAGTATFSAAGVISSVSDETWKIKDGVPADPNAMLKKLQPGYWYYNDEKKEIFGEERQLGFYAQNVNAAIGPEAAPKPEEGKPWGYYDRSVLAVAVMSLQKALDTIDLLTARIAALEQK